MKKISTRIILIVLVCSISMSLLVGITSMFNSIRVIKKESKEKLLNTAKIYSGRFNEDLVLFEGILNNIDKIVSGTVNMSRLKENGYLNNYSETVLKPIVKEITKETRKCAGIYIALDPKYTGRTEGVWIKLDDNGTLMQSLPVEISGKKEDDPSVSFYYDAIKSGVGTWSDPRFNNASFNVMTYSAPIVIDNEILGVIGIDLRVKDLVKAVEDVEVYDTGYAFILNKNYDYIIHPTLDRSNNLRTIDDGKYNYIAEEVEENEAGVVDTDFGGEKKIMVFSKLHDGKVIALTVPNREVLQDMYRTIYINFGVIIVAAVLAIVVALIAARRISEPINLVSGILSKTSNLDLTHSEETKEIKALDKREDEVGAIFKATATLRGEMRKIISEIEETTLNIVENTNSLTTATNETTQSINDMAKTVDELAQASMGQAEDAETGSEKLYRLANEIKAAVEDGELVVESSIKAQKINEEGSKAMNNMVEKFSITNEATRVVAKNVDSLSEMSHSIGGILNTIMDISEQTNLLALNAAIEAARAGEAGRGFAVVAEEIRKLSEETGHATKNIEGILNTIQVEVEATKGSMVESEEALDDANKTLEQVKNGFEEIYRAILISIGAIEQLDGRLEVVNKDKEDAILAIQSISSVTEETAASTEELSASMEEQAATMETISNNTDNLAKTIEKLNGLVNRFKL